LRSSVQSTNGSEIGEDDAKEIAARMPALARTSHQSEVVGPGTGRAGLQPRRNRRRTSSFRLASRTACGRKLCGRRGRATMSGPCNGGAEAPPFPDAVRNPRQAHALMMEN